ncbi:low affinity iron permease family protein [Bordetella petrii]|uniref:low affinity iron permease family protein n=1 Tax=Bordetella petrii TaxID=94624 RepID=UPI00047904A5|nr:low affinity iron permease family protein [Bordetella petrii]
MKPRTRSGKLERGGRRRAARQTRPQPRQARPQSSAARMFDHFATAVARATGSPIAFGMAVALIVLWAIAGPWAGFSEVWQLVVNTGTTIITFLMVFLIQQNQNKDSRALHVKLDELLMALKGANEKLVDIEEMEEDELDEVVERYRQLALAARKRKSFK